MRIQDTKLPEIAQRATESRRPDGPAAADGDSDDGVVVPPGVQERAALAGRTTGASEERIAALRLQVQSGSYKVDARKLAEKLVDEDPAAVTGRK